MRTVALWCLLAALSCSCSTDAAGDGDAAAVGGCAADDCVTFLTGDGRGSAEARTMADVSAPDVENAAADVETAAAPDLVETPDSAPPPVGVGDITVDPLQHTFTYLPGVGNPQTKTVTIYNEGDASLTIEKIEWTDLSSPEFTFMALPPLPKKLNPGQQTAVTVIFKEKSPHGPATLRIHSTDVDEAMVEVQFNSQSKSGDEPCVQVQPSSLNFGQVTRGDVKNLAFQVVNCSSSLPVTITKIDRSKFFGMALTDEFQIVPMPALPFTLAGNEAMPLEVSYAPGLAGMDNGYFTFVTQEAGLTDPKLDVYGVGVPPPLEEIGLHIEMEWDVDNSDVDLHLVKPGGTLFDCDDDCYYANMSPDWGVAGDTLDDPFLDYDDVDGFGPENTNLSEPEPGTYQVTMHYYDDSYEAWSGGPTGVTVRVYSYGTLLGTFGPRTLTHTNHTWDVCLVEWPGAALTVVDSLYEAPDQPMCLPW